MPLYQYECNSCERQFDDLRKYDERDDPAECPECGHAARRVLAGFAVGSDSGKSSGQPAGPSCTIGGG